VKKLLCLGLAAGMLSACNGTAPMMAAAPLMQQPIQAQSDAGVRQAIKATFEMGFESLDKNKDGFLTAEEANMVPEIFNKADADKDKKLSLKEFLYANSKVGKSAFQFIKNLAYQAYTQLDANHDGFFTVDELQAQLKTLPTGAQSVHSTLFFTADRNHDRKLTLSEYEDVAAWTLVGSMTGSPIAPGPISPGSGQVTPPPPPAPVPVSPAPANPTPANSTAPYPAPPTTK
jgi:Ca2+-binding EF-hand superfamily protein